MENDERILLTTAYRLLTCIISVRKTLQEMCGVFSLHSEIHDTCGVMHFDIMVE